MIAQGKTKFFTLSALLLMLLAWRPATAAEEQQQPKLETDDQKLSYVLGTDFGEVIKRLKADANIDTALIMRAIDDVLTGKTPLLASEQANEIKRTFSQKLQERLAAERKAQAEKNRAEGEAFLAQNKTKPGVITTPSGLQYEVIKAGEGEKPTANDVVTVNYRGALLDGSEFDSSYKSGKPAAFPVGGVIPGWSEALQLMPVGGKYRLFIPASLGYGERGAGRQIGPNATLVFEVELLGINKETGASAEPAPAGAQPQTGSKPPEGPAKPPPPPAGAQSPATPAPK